jgi:hypothetical protein
LLSTSSPVPKISFTIVIAAKDKNAKPRIANAAILPFFDSAKL